MKTIYKRIILISVILMLLFSINAKVFAWSEIIKDGQDFISTGQQDSSASQARINQENMKSGLQGLSGYLYNILLVAGVVIAVIVATVLGIQFMIGGAEGQAKVKEMLVPFVVGCVVVFGGFGIWKIAVNIGSNIESTGTSSTYTRDSEGDPVCKYCGEKLTRKEQRQGKCDDCGRSTGI